MATIEELDALIASSTKSAPRNYDELINKYSTQYGVDPSLPRAIFEQESAFDPNAISPAGAGGIAQFMPSTWEAVGKQMGESSGNRFDPETAIRRGVYHIADLVKKLGSEEKAIAAYKSGEGSVRKAGGIPTTYDPYVSESTPDYVKKVLAKRGQPSVTSSGPSITPEKIAELDQLILSEQKISELDDIIAKSDTTAQEQQPQEQPQRKPLGATRSFEPSIEPEIQTEQPSSTVVETPTIRAPGQAYIDVPSLTRELTPEEEAKAQSGIERRQLESAPNFEKSAVGAAAYGVAGSIAGPFIPPSEGAETAQKAQPIAYTAGEVAGTIAQAVAGGNLVAKGFSKVPYIANNPIFKDILTRGITSGGLSGIRNTSDLVKGKKSFKDAFLDTIQAAGAGAVSVIPEVYAPAGAWQLLAQPLADLTFDVIADSARQKNVGSADWWKAEVLNLALAEGFAIKDVASGDVFKIEQAGKRQQLRDWLIGKEVELVPTDKIKTKIPEQPRPELDAKSKEIIDVDRRLEDLLSEVKDPKKKARLSAKLKDDLLGDYKVTKFDEIDDIQGELEKNNIPYIFESTDGGNLGGLNKFYKDDHTRANKDIKAVWGDVYARMVTENGGVIGRSQGDEFKVIWPNKTLDEVEVIRSDIEQAMLDKIAELGIDKVPHPKHGYIETGALYTDYGLVDVGKEAKPGSYGEINRVADLKMGAAKDERISAYEQGEITKTPGLEEPEGSIAGVEAPRIEANKEAIVSEKPTEQPATRTELINQTRTNIVENKKSPIASDINQRQYFQTGQKDEVLSSQSGAARLPGSPKTETQPDVKGIKGPSKLKTFAKWAAKWFAPGEGLPEYVFRYKILRDGRIANRLRDIETTINDFRKASKEAYGKTRLSDTEAQDIDFVLKGEKSIDDLPEQMRPVVERMRGEIDALSQMMIDNGLVSGDLADVVSQNLGFYARRSYRIFNEPKWAENVPADTRNAAKAYIYDDTVTYHTNRAEDLLSKMHEIAGVKANLQEIKQLNNEYWGKSQAGHAVKITEDRFELQRQAEGLEQSAETKRLLASDDERVAQIRQEERYVSDRIITIEDEFETVANNLNTLKQSLEKAVESGDDWRISDIESRIDEALGKQADLQRQLMWEADELHQKLVEHRVESSESSEQLKYRAEGLKKEAVKEEALSKDLFNREKERSLERMSSTIMKSVDARINEIDAKIDEINKIYQDHLIKAKPTDEEIEGRIDELLYKGGRPLNVLASGSKLGSKNLDMLKRRKDIPPEIRALWGEYKNADVNYVTSVWGMASAIENDRFLKEVLAAGEGKHFFPPSDKEGGGPRRIGDESYSAKFASDKNKSLAPLNGWYTSPEIKRAFEEAVEAQNNPQWLRLILRAQSAVKYAKTIGSVMTHMRNTTGNAAFALANGHYNILKAGKALGATSEDIGLSNFAKNVLERFGVEGKFDTQKYREYIKELTELGVVNDGARAGEIREVIRDATQGDIDRLIGTGKKQFVRKAMHGIEKLYGAEDDVWKIFAFENEYARYKKAYPDMPDAELKEKVAKIVRDTYPTYSMTPKIVKLLRRSPVVGTFVSFPAEVIRTGFNTIGLAAKEIADPATRTIGMQRLSGILLASSVTAIASTATAYTVGMNEKKKKAIRRFLAPWSKNSQLIHLPSKDNESVFIDMGYNDPHAYLKGAALALLRGENWEEKIVETAAELFDPFISEDILYSKITDVLRNTTKDGRPVYLEADEPLNKAWDIAMHFADALTPGTITGLERMYKATQKQEGKFGQKYDAKIEAIAQSTGFRITKVNPLNSLAYKAFSFNDKLASARELKRKRGQEQEYQKTLEAYREMSKDVQACRIYGYGDKEIYNRLTKDAGLSGVKARALISGQYESYVKSQFEKRTPK